MMVRSLLWLASQPYMGAIGVRNWAYERGWLRREKVSIPVVSVGNLTVGGTGKSPAVAMIAKYFRESDIRVAIVSRGYAAGLDGVNDEAKELELKLPDVPHLQNPDRAAAAKIAYEELDSQLILLDDGFQHRRLDRDLDIVLLDAMEPFGYGYLLPRGLLREPIRSLKRAAVVLVTRADQVDPQKLADIRTIVQRYAPTAAWVETRHQPVRLRQHDGATRGVESLARQRVFAFCGLGNPQGFLQTLKSLDVELADSILFPDHHPYSREDIEMIRGKVESLGEVDAIICTGKDLPKIGISQLGGRDVWSLDIEMEVIAGWEAMRDRLARLVAN